MATFLRDWSYRYPWLYDSISWAATLTVGGKARFHQLPLQGLNLTPETKVLDLCCGGGQATYFLVQHSHQVTGLDASPRSLQTAQRHVPQAQYIQGFAEDLPLEEGSFDLVHTSAALHEMEPEQLQQILREVHRVLKPGGVFALMDFHKPRNPLFWPGVAMFLWLFETETAWQLLETDLTNLLRQVGFEIQNQCFYAGASLQVVQARKL